MTGQTIGRRQAFRAAAGVAAGGVLATGAGVSSATAANDRGGHGLLGSWRVTHRNDPPAPPEKAVAVVSFASGGVAISHDISPAGPPFTGTWAHLENGRFRATLWSGFSGPGAPPSAGQTGRLRAKGRLRHGKISGTFAFTLFDTNGKEVESANGTFSGTFISA